MEKAAGFEVISGLLKSIFSPQMAFAGLGALMFWYTIVEPDKLMLTEDPNRAPTKNDILANNPAVLELAAAQEPMKLLADNKADMAVRSANQLAESKPHDLIANIAAGNVLFRVGDKENGYRLLKRAVSLAPKGRYVRLNLAEILTQDKQYDKAISQYQLISQAYPHWAKPHIELANIYLAQENAPQEADELKQASESEPNNGELHKMLGLAQAQMGRGKQGLEEYVEGDNLEINNSGMPEDLKRLVAYWHTLDRAAFELQRQMAEHPDDANIKLALARIYMYTGRTADAKSLLMDARKKANSNIDVHRNLALVLQKLGDSGLAISEFMLSVTLEKASKKLNEPPS